MSAMRSSSHDCMNRSGDNLDRKRGTLNDYCLPSNKARTMTASGDAGSEKNLIMLPNLPSYVRGWYDREYFPKPRSRLKRMPGHTTSAASEACQLDGNGSLRKGPEAYSGISAHSCYKVIETNTTYLKGLILIHRCTACSES